MSRGAGGHTHRSVGCDGGQQDSTQSPPGGADQQRRDEDAGGHGQTVRPAGQEEVGEREQTQGQGVVRVCERHTQQGKMVNPAVFVHSFIPQRRAHAGFTCLVVEEAADTPLRCVEEGGRHGVILSIWAEQLRT